MRTTQANRYARWAAIIAAVLALGMVAVYIRHSYQAHVDVKNAPPTVPAAVEKSSQTFTYTSGDKDKTVWTLRASTVTVFKDTNRSVLEDVWITIYGRKGDRSDNIHTHSCEYLRDPDRFLCAGVVQMDLQSADDAHRVAAAPPVGNPEARIVHATTKGVTFDKDSGEASTDQQIDFRFPGGTGSALGFTYHSDDGVLLLRSKVNMNLTPAPPRNPLRNPAAAAVASSPVNLTAASLEFRRESRTMLLHGPVVATQAVPSAAHLQPVSASTGNAAAPFQRDLHASLVTIDLDKQFHARTVKAEGDSTSRPKLNSTDAKASGTVTADQFIADLAPAGWIQKLSAVGNVVGEEKSAVDVNHVSAARLDLDMVSKINQPKTLSANGAVKLDTTRASISKSMETASMVLDFVPAPPKKPGMQASYRPGTVRSLAPATVMLHEPVPGQPATQQRVTRITGQRIEADLSDRSHLRRMAAHGGTEIERDLPGKPPQTSTSQDLVTEFDSQGQWTTVDQSGNVRFKYADRSGQANKSHMDRATEFVTLTGAVEAADAATRTTADSITFNQRTGEIHADGNVLSTYRKPAGTAASATSSGMGLATSLGPDPAHITSEHLVGNSDSGHAVYTGHARLWQGDSTMEADEIELDRATRQVDARGNVRAVFLQTTSTSGTQQVFPSTRSGKPAAPAGKQSAPSGQTAGPSQPEVWHIRSGTLTYFEDQSKVHLDKGFTAESQKGSMTGKVCDLFYTSAAGAPQPQPNGTPSALGAAKRLDRLAATGNVVVKDQANRGTADRADYSSAAGTFVLSGGNPTIYDDAGNSTRGRQLTLFLADDTILVESDEGSRTITRYRVKK